MIRPAACASCRGPLEPDDVDGLCAGCLQRSLLFDLPDEEGPARGGADLGDYELLAEIARGGMGVVFRARSRRLKRVVALKLVHVSAAVGDSLRSRFLFEAETAAGLDHPNIVPVYEFGESDGRPWFSMKLVEGGSLEDRIHEFSLVEGTPNPERCRRAAQLLSTVARAVQHAHDRGVLHRDLKPSNILLDPQGVPHVTDFGLAKRLEGGGSLTLPESVLGTPAYMAPEVARSGSAAAGVRSDIYSLGSVLHHLLAGRPPFSGHSALDLIRQVAESATPSASRLGRQVDRDLGLICSKCLEHSEARRYATAGELADDLDRYLRGEPVVARSITSLERMALWARRHPAMALLSAVLALALVAGTSGVLWQWRKAKSSAAAAQEAERRTAENAYFAVLEQARSAREQGDIGRAARLLDGLDPGRRGFEWRLLHAFCRGDALRSFAYPGGDPQVVEWVPSRRRLAVLARDRRLRWLDPADGRFTDGPAVPPPVLAPEQEVLDYGFHTLSFAPDGRHFLCGDGDVLQVVETESGRVLQTGFGRHMGGVWIDADHLLYGGNVNWGASRGDPTVLFNVRDGSARRLPSDRFGPFALSRDGRRLAWARLSGGMELMQVVAVSDLFEARPRGRFLDATNISPGWMAFAHDGRHLVMAGGHQSGSLDEVGLVDIDTGITLFTQRFPMAIRALRLHPEEPEIAIATDDAVLRTLRFLPPPSAAGTNAPPASYDDDAVPEGSEPVRAGGAVYPPGRLLSRSAGSGRYQFLLGHRGRLRDVKPSNDGSGWWTAAADGTIGLWPRASAAPLSRVGGIETKNPWEHPTVSADGRWVLYRDAEDRTRSLDRSTGESGVSPRGHHPLAVLRDGRALTRDAVSEDIFCWPTDNGSVGAAEPVWRFRGPQGYPGHQQVVRAALSKDERRLAVVTPGILMVIDLEKRGGFGTDDQRMLHGASGVNGMDLSPDGRSLVVTGLVGRHVRVYSADDLHGGFRTLGDAEDYDTAVAFHPDGRRIFVGNEDGKVRVFDVETGAEFRGAAWQAQTGAVIALAVSSDGRMVATSGDRTLRFWDAEADPVTGTRRERLQVGVPTARNWMRFAQGDRVFLHVAPGQPLEAWEAP
jgi:hypothetical protein